MKVEVLQLLANGTGVGRRPVVSPLVSQRPGGSEGCHAYKSKQHQERGCATYLHEATPAPKGILVGGLKQRLRIKGVGDIKSRSCDAAPCAMIGLLQYSDVLMLVLCS